MNEDEYKVNLKDEVNQKDLVEENPCNNCYVWEMWKEFERDKLNPHPISGVTQCEFCPDRLKRRQ
ncbi:MAG: hypothetical protein ACP5HL_01850 [Minisyncoccia bacterium]